MGVSTKNDAQDNKWKLFVSGGAVLVALVIGAVWLLRPADEPAITPPAAPVVNNVDVTPPPPSHPARRPRDNPAGDEARRLPGGESADAPELNKEGPARPRRDPVKPDKAEPKKPAAVFREDSIG